MNELVDTGIVEYSSSRESNTNEMRVTIDWLLCTPRCITPGPSWWTISQMQIVVQVGIGGRYQFEQELSV